MGGHPYWYVVPYESDIDAALQKLKQREFEAGRYNPVISFLEFPIGPDSPAPGRQHASIDDALAGTDADGTRSILDTVRGVLPNPYNTDQDLSGMDVPIAGVSPLAEPDLVELFGSARPSRETVEREIAESPAFWERLMRGTAVYVVLHADSEPREIFFAGISFD
ncbi:MAG TPA: hypothetical protein VFZ16_06610 [Hyphomicrobiaceae bacterium]|nr:hypothetical protein [Hyphomicrobiaceae bacterium]